MPTYLNMTTDELKRIVIGAARKRVDEFQKITGGFEDRGILNSEMLAVCSLAEELGVEVFIESGRWLGQSTEVLARYFENKPVIIESVEAFYDENAVHVEEKMKGKKNLHLLYGDANLVVPQLMKKYQGEKMAILFDGPKGGAAIDVFRMGLTKSDSVIAGFFHDMRRPSQEMPNNSRREMEAVFPVSFYTDDDDFVKEFGSLDSGCEIALWRPYQIDGKPIGSYGPTLGITLPRPDDRLRAHAERWDIYTRMTKQALTLGAVKIYHWIRRSTGR